MEAKQSVSRKRKESPNPLSGTFTRRKSQIYTHLNRSGRFRSDAGILTPHGNLRHRQNAKTEVSHAPGSRRKSSNPAAGDDGRVMTLSQTCIKDLRARRVFSEPLVGAEQEDKKPEVNGTVEVNPKLKFGDFDCVKNVSLSDGFGEELSWSRPDGEGEKADVGVNCIGRGAFYGNTNLSGSMGLRPEEKGFGQGGQKLGFQKVDDSACNGLQLDDFSPTVPNRDQITDEENVQATPPDPDIFPKQLDGKNRFAGGENVLQAEENCAGILLSGSPRTCGVENKLRSPNRKIDRVPRRKLVLNPCARLKVFNTPSSVSYRRLLPYLLDIAKDNSCALEMKSCPKIEIVSEEKSSIQPLVPLACNNQMSMSDVKDKALKPMLHTASEEMTGDGSVEEKLPSDMLACDSLNQIPSIPVSTDCSSDNTSQTAVTTDSQNVMPSPSNSPQGESSLVGEVSSAKSSEINTMLNNISPALVSESAVSITDVTVKAPHSSSDGNHKTNVKICEGTITVFQSASPVEALPSSEPSTASPTKGILKRNPRGCRGLCTCLNCASFRLHAERAFEFSRNQLQDTEEVVLELRKELSQLRTVLESFLGDSNNQASPNNLQVKEVCASASKAEEVARTRLKEMTEDLFAHCRIKCLQRPRVNFAIKTEETGCQREKPV